jgi:7-keto-8-aminopelargonate synthetase-like enzyme
MIEVMNQIMNDGLKKQLTHQFTENENISGSEICIGGEELINFGSCSYLGLEFHPNLKKGVQEAVEKFGTQFSSSRAYLSIGLYQKLEAELTRIFEQPVIATASTTLGHMAALPVLIRENDAVIIDLQVHSSVQMAVQILKARKVNTYVIPHNDMESLENKIKSLRDKHQKIWYLADGIYSMYGDCAPVHQLEELLNKYKQFHLYIDDAHGMSWTGKNGVGYVRSQIEHHPKMVLVSSLNKSFASSGGVLVFPNEEMKKDVLNCGSTLIFSGPIQPPMLGAALASAKLHLSQEIEHYQMELKRKIDFTNQRLKELNLPQYCESDSPLFFIPCGLPKFISNILQRMKNQGFFLNAASFPAVPMKKGGIRFMINNNLNTEEIGKMLDTLQREYVLGLQEEGSSVKDVAKTFRIPEFNISIDANESNVVQLPGTLTAKIHRSIATISAQEWDASFQKKGNLLHHNLMQLEEVFSRNMEKENNWKNYYYIVRDHNNEVVLKAFYTCAQIMDDMLAPANISAKVKEQREFDPYFLTSKAVLSGSLFSKGESIAIDTENPHWKEALEMLIKQMQTTAEREKASKVLLRELDTIQNKQLKDFMLELGFVENKLPGNCVIEDLKWNSLEEFMAGMGQKYRYGLRKEILAYEDQFVVEFNKPKTKEELQHGYQLYREVYKKALAISVFELPFSLFEMMNESEHYDIMTLYLKDQPEKPVAIMYSFINHGVYSAMMVGLDYRFVKTHNTYKQILFQTVKRAKALGCEKIDLAYTAEMEKKKVGAKVEGAYAYTMAMEHYSFALLNAMN